MSKIEYSRYKGIYHCPLCGTNIETGIIASDIYSAKKYLDQLITKDKMNLPFEDRKMIAYHNCKDGSVGLATLIGLKNIGL